MSSETLNPASARFDFMKWVSSRNAYIPISEMEFLLASPPIGIEDDWGDDDWDNDD